MIEMDSIKESKQGEEGMKAGRERKRKKLYAFLSSERESKKILKTYKN